MQTCHLYTLMLLLFHQSIHVCHQPLLASSVSFPLLSSPPFPSLSFFLHYSSPSPSFLSFLLPSRPPVCSSSLCLFRRCASLLYLNVEAQFPQRSVSYLFWPRHSSLRYRQTSTPESGVGRPAPSPRKCNLKMLFGDIFCSFSKHQDQRRHSYSE